MAGRGAVLGTGDGSGNLSQTQNDVVFTPNVLTFDFVGAPIPTGDGVLTLTATADLDGGTEFLSVDAEGVFTQDVFVTGGQQQIEVMTTINITQADLISLQSDGTISFTVTPSAAVNNLGPNELTLELVYPSSGGNEDWYNFSLDDGESATLAVTEQTAGNLSLELFDATGTTLLASGIAAANVGQVINNFVDQTSDTTPDNYLVRVTGDTVGYSLMVTRNSDFDTEANNDSDNNDSIQSRALRD